MKTELTEMMNILWNMAPIVPNGHPVEAHLDRVMSALLDAINEVKGEESK